MAGKASGFTCPSCGGARWQVDEGLMSRYECHVGHRYSSESLQRSQDVEVESALWAALRALQGRRSTGDWRA
jgi:two-component system chemotaxis response regulator CheB